MRCPRSTTRVSTCNWVRRAAIESPACPPPTTSTTGSLSPLGLNVPTRSSNPFISSSAVSSVHARNVFFSSGRRRNTPLPRPSAVSNWKIASIASVPARVTWRGAVRCGSVLKPDGWARPFGQVLRHQPDVRVLGPFDRPAVGFDDLRCAGEERRLARAVRSDDRDLLPRLDREAEIADDRMVVGLRQLLHFDRKPVELLFAFEADER